MSASRRTRRRNQTAEGNARRAAEKASTERAEYQHRITEASTAALAEANRWLAAGYPELAQVGYRFDWADDEGEDE